MDDKKIYLKSEHNTNKNKLKLSELKLTMNNFTQKINKSKTKLDYSKIKINRDILSNLIKTSNLKKLHKINRTQTKLHYFHKAKNEFNKDLKISTNLNDKFMDLPSISKYRNITSEKINDLLKSSNEDCSNKSFFFKKNFIYKGAYKRQKKSHKMSQRNKTAFISRNITESKDNMETIKNNNKYQRKNKSLNDNKLLFKLSLDTKKSHLKVKELNNEENNNLFCLKTPIINFQNNNNETISIKSNKFKNNNKDIINKMRLNNLRNKRVNKSFNKKWLNTLKEFIRSYDFYNKEIKKENQQVYFIGKPSKDEIVKRENEDEDEDENENEFLLFKDKIKKHKDKFGKLMSKLKESQMNQEYLTKKYIFDLITNKNKLE